MIKCVTFQSLEFLENLIRDKEIVCDSAKASKKIPKAYEWVSGKLRDYSYVDGVAFPIWCWVRCRNGICPPRVKGTPVPNFDCKITFHKQSSDVLVMDYAKYSFVLNNQYIPKDKKDYDRWLNLLFMRGITQEDLRAYHRIDKYSSCRSDDLFKLTCREVHDSFDRCLTDLDNIQQGVFWKLGLSEVDSIEILHGDGYSYGSLNYVRSGGKRVNWINKVVSEL